MYLNTGMTGIDVVREASDRARRSEARIGRLLASLLNKRDGSGWRAFNPSQHGLTSCTVGARNAARGIVYWHERYQIEDAAQAFNAGSVFFLKA